MFLFTALQTTGGPPARPPSLFLRQTPSARSSSGGLLPLSAVSLIVPYGFPLYVPCLVIGLLVFWGCLCSCPLEISSLFESRSAQLSTTPDYPADTDSAPPVAQSAHTCSPFPVPRTHFPPSGPCSLPLDCLSPVAGAIPTPQVLSPELSPLNQVMEFHIKFSHNID